MMSHCELCNLYCGVKTYRQLVQTLILCGRYPKGSCPGWLLCPSWYFWLSVRSGKCACAASMAVILLWFFLFAVLFNQVAKPHQYAPSKDLLFYSPTEIDQGFCDLSIFIKELCLHGAFLMSQPVCSDQERESDTWMPKNLKLLIIPLRTLLM